MKQVVRRDGHIHTPFCPHGSKDAMKDYVEEALRLGLEEISFTEHFPLPKGITDPEFEAECALQEQQIADYFEAVEGLQKYYQGKIKINKGFEVDFIEGREEEIKALLNQYGSEIEDSILSVHFVYYNQQYYAVDYEPDVERLLKELPDRASLYDLYFKTIIKSVEADLGRYKPKRIGHPSLVRIFQKKWPIQYDDHGLYEELVKKLKLAEYEIDFNVAGLRKTYCGESYPTGQLLSLIKQYQIPMVMGSDSHEVGQMKWLKEVENDKKSNLDESF